MAVVGGRAEVLGRGRGRQSLPLKGRFCLRSAVRLKGRAFVARATPNRSIERTAVGKPPAAAHVER